MVKLVVFLVTIMDFRILPGRGKRCFKVEDFSCSSSSAFLLWHVTSRQILVFRILPGQASANVSKLKLLYVHCQSSAFMMWLHDAMSNIGLKNFVKPTRFHVYARLVFYNN